MILLPPALKNGRDTTCGHSTSLHSFQWRLVDVSVPQLRNKAAGGRPIDGFEPLSRKWKQ